MDVGFKTDRGRMRSNNEDACYVMRKEKVFLVADGVGGSRSGEIASRTAVNGIADYVREHPLDAIRTTQQVKEYFEEAIKKINFDILDSSQRFEENRGMATTIVLAILVEDRMYVFNIGDSRAYIFREGILTQITEDHTYVNSLVKAGIITSQEAETHENRNMITRAVGADYNVEADLFLTKVQPGDILLLCSDGLYGEVSKGELEAILSEGKPMMQTCETLVGAANRNGGNDNITAISLKIMEDDIHE